VITTWGLAADQSLGDEKKCTAYSLFCIFIVSIIIVIIRLVNVSSSISISFVAIINCLYLNPGVSSFVHFSSSSYRGGRGGVRAWLFGA